MTLSEDAGDGGVDAGHEVVDRGVRLDQPRSWIARRIAQEPCSPLAAGRPRDECAGSVIRADALAEKRAARGSERGSRRGPDLKRRAGKCSFLHRYTCRRGYARIPLFASMETPPRRVVSCGGT